MTLLNARPLAAAAELAAPMLVLCGEFDEGQAPGAQSCSSQPKPSSRAISNYPAPAISATRATGGFLVAARESWTCKENINILDHRSSKPSIASEHGLPLSDRDLPCESQHMDG